MKIRRKGITRRIARVMGIVAKAVLKERGCGKVFSSKAPSVENWARVQNI